MDEVICKLEEVSIFIIQWFKNNYLKPNPDKWHLLLTQKNKEYSVIVDGYVISNSEQEKLLGVHFDNELRFKTHVEKLCKKAGQKLLALARISNFMSIEKRKMLINLFILSQFSYCLLI